MKIYYLLFMITLLSCNSISLEKKNQAKRFNDQLIEYSLPITQDLNSLFSLNKELLINSIQGSLNKSAIEHFDRSIDDLNLKIDTSLTSVSILNEFDSKIKYKEAILNYLSVCKATLNKEYKILSATYQKEMTPENLSICGETEIAIWGSLLKLEKNTSNIQQEFANKYSLTLEVKPRDWRQLEMEFNSYKIQFESLKLEK